ncbi:TaqI-like C-terminal specificity domain-containing protein [Bizionia echini]|uniref:site-specific DNA-methyltransferase (adenine-specific) n=1 Tax=Bizionia echini TaxID=649333 RepID=A0A1I5C1P6_9FLAO|nr:DNA methyltransferase [Bizionia echini]SFN80836.1 TaqI-like C-terminal specificity domain-containing protein [Bizionia echini]
MALFQTSVIKTYLAQQDNSVVERAYKKYTKYFHNATIQENIKNSKEEQYQAKFLDELFVNVLGYILNPKPDFNITTEFKNQKGAGKADGAILSKGNAIGVIELKGTNTKDLESIRKQAFDYKANQKGCVYVITSNFEKLRFYINDATEFLEFNLFQLAPEEFALMYLCLQKDNILNNLPLTIKEASLVEEDKITKQFYNDYSVFKRELFRDLVKRNAKRIKMDAVIASEARQSLEENNANENKALEKNVKLSLFKKSQKLIDRFLFIFFAEDRDLLPPNSTIQILDKWKADIDFGDERPLYNLFKQYFHFLDEGRKGTTSRAEIYAYNGGLFKPDAIIDSLEIDDDLLYKHTYKLAKYDFSSQVDVNILGHIFENSLNEIESVNAEIEGGEFDKQKSKRKKDGVFYTPKYITKYIVENTVGKLCQEKKDQLGFKEEAYFEIKKGTHQNTKKQLLEVLDNYRAWLLQITICDPACGSGAFLNQALDFLIKEHRYIDELKAKVLGGGFILSDIENTILENNIYGVDLNEESVEIAKLSLWLRTAQPRRKLNDLSNNIKCGNSLIDSKTVAGDKAFNWQQEFPQIFDKGGFDVIIGNPPYVRNEFIDTESKKYLEKRYEVFTGKSDLYVFFFEKSLVNLKENGKCGFIVSSKYTKTKYGKPLIEYLQNNSRINSFIDFRDLDVFSGIVAYPSIILFDKEKINSNKSESKLLVVSEENYQEVENNFQNSIEVIQSEIFKRLGSWSTGSLDNKLFSLIRKIEDENKKLSEVIDKPQVGIKTGSNTSYIMNKEEVPEEIKNSVLLKEYLVGREVKKYNPIDTANKIVFPYEQSENQVLALIEDFNNHREVISFLEKDKDKLSNRAIIDKGIEKGTKKWYEYQQIKLNFPFREEYIVYPDISSAVNFTIAKDVLIDMTCFGLPTNSKSVLGILNSKLIEVYLNSVCVKARGGYLRLKSQYILNIPLPENFESKDLNSAVTLVLDTYSSFNDQKRKFINFVLSQNNISVNKKLENWHELDFSDFIKELNKAIKKAGGTPLTKKDEFEWLELFEDNKKKAQELQTQITQTEKTIDNMVYDLYGLTEEERDIIENS